MEDLKSPSPEMISEAKDLEGSTNSSCIGLTLGLPSALDKVALESPVKPHRLLRLDEDRMRKMRAHQRLRQDERPVEHDHREGAQGSVLAAPRVGGKVVDRDADALSDLEECQVLGKERKVERARVVKIDVLAITPEVGALVDVIAVLRQDHRALVAQPGLQHAGKGRLARAAPASDADDLDGWTHQAPTVSNRRSPASPSPGSR
jgi:hypothetical protein